MIDGEASLATRAAWLYFAAGLTQSEVADRLNIQSTKAHRLIARASRESMIRVFVEGSVAECVALENALTQRFSLALCRVAPDLGDRELPLKALALEGASFLRQILEHGEDQVIGVGYGQTLAAVVEQLPQTSAQEVVALKHMGACAHMLGHFFSEDGSLLNTDLSARAISMTAADLEEASHCRDWRRTGQGDRAAGRAAQPHAARTHYRRSDRTGARCRRAGDHLQRSKNQKPDL